MKYWYAIETNCYYERHTPGAENHVEVSKRPGPGYQINPETMKWFLPVEYLEKQARNSRDRLLLETDYLMLPDYPLENRGEWEAYRQALRDITKQEGFPDDIQWPEKPE